MYSVVKCLKKRNQKYQFRNQAKQTVKNLRKWKRAKNAKNPRKSLQKNQRRAEPRLARILKSFPSSVTPKAMARRLP
ncbi:hypothetical protein G9C98_002014 [Cotesia typhae]|uniref:Uncharacterized protein n=1 Tax=Cotesia typhae TaxID=2053667 RepID=A0A8J5V111_9HYME|nr:hypothetical protein G9C98_002014 [Cotesia typhae]